MPWTPVCATSELVAGTVRQVTIKSGDSRDSREAFVVRTPTGEVRGFLNQCRHRRRRLNEEHEDICGPDNAHVQCSLHAAIYRLSDGMCVSGPCEGQALFPLAIRIEDETVWLET